MLIDHVPPSDVFSDSLSKRASLDANATSGQVVLSGTLRAHTKFVLSCLLAVLLKFMFGRSVHTLCSPCRHNVLLGVCSLSEAPRLPPGSKA